VDVNGGCYNFLRVATKVNGGSVFATLVCDDEG